MRRQNQGAGGIPDPVLIHPGQEVQPIRVHNQPAGIVFQQVFQRLSGAFPGADAHAEGDGFHIGNQLRDFFFREDDFVSVIT